MTSKSQTNLPNSWKLANLCEVAELNPRLDKQQKAFLKHEAFHGNEIVANTRQLCLMNMFLHNIGEIDGDAAISSNDSLVADAGQRFDYVLANPPFGKKSSMSFTNEEGEQKKDDLTYNRRDFWATTSNKQLNFVQHIRTMLKTTGRAAVVVPDNVLFEGEAGETIRKLLLDTTDLHTILRLPTGVFYAQGVKDKSLTDLDTLPEPDELAAEIIENLEAGLSSFRHVLAGLGSG